MKKARLLIIIFFLCLIVVVVNFISVGLRSCGWLDTFQNRSGCVHQLDAVGAVAQIIFSPDSTTFATLSLNREVQLWDSEDAVLQRTLIEGGGDATIYHITFSPDGNTLGIIFWGTIQLWKVSNGTVMRTLHLNTSLQNVSLSPDWMILASGHSGGKLVWRTFENGVPLHKLQGDKYVVEAVAFSPNGDLLASGGGDSLIRLWRVDNGDLVRTLEGHTHVVEDVTFSPDGSMLASGSDDQTVRLWRVSDGKLLYTLEGHTHRVFKVAFSPDGLILASAGGDGKAQLWQVDSGQLLHTIKVESMAWDVNFSPDGRWLALAQSHGPARLFDVERLNLR